ncbi:MAG: DUF6794 domain-containing protein [Bacteroidota bacterium]
MIKYNYIYYKLILGLLFGCTFNTLFSQKDSLYNIQRHKADSSYEFNWSVKQLVPSDSVKYIFSKNLYLKALSLKPNDTYSKKRIIEINRILDKIQLDKVCLEYKYNLEHNSIYFPKNLGECLMQLDSILCNDIKNEIKSLSNRKEMIKYHFSLGLYLRNYMIRNNAQLSDYFLKRGVNQLDYMSSIILDYYYDWINGKKGTWKEWEKKNRRIK